MVTAHSNSEAEYCALANTSQELVWLHWLLEDMGVTHSSPVRIYCDNHSAIQIAHNDVFLERTKHIEIDCHFVRHHLHHGTFSLFPVSSLDQINDIHTKSLSSACFHHLKNKLKLVSLQPS